MLIDWVTARVPLEDLTDEARECVRQIGDRITCYCPKTGEAKWTTFAWDSIRSDSHQIAVRVGTDLWIQGSPARVIGEGDTVFGAGATAALDLRGCVERMASFVAGRLGVKLPRWDRWLVTRVDVTGNLELGSLEEVHQALTILRDCEGGRYRVSQQQGDTVYWSQRSRLKAGKAYAKGPHLEHLKKVKTYSGRGYTPQDIEAANRLLRLELRLGREYWSRHDWKRADAEQLRNEWADYFGRMIGGAEMTTDSDVKARVMAAASTEGRGRAAYGCWLLIQAEGWERARSSYAKSTWYDHLKVLHRAGLGDADISAGRVVPLRRRVMEARLVTSWDQLKAA